MGTHPIKVVPAEAPVVIDARLPVPAAASADGVFVRPDATAEQVRRAVDMWRLLVSRRAAAAA